MVIDQALGWAATVIFSVMLVPQIAKTLRTSTLEGVSLPTYGLFFAGNVIALVYAIRIEQWPLIAKYALAILSVVVFFGVVVRLVLGATKW